MYVVFVCGGIASGKSTVAERLAERGGVRIDLDGMSRVVLQPGSECLTEIAREFGSDLIDVDTGELNRKLLAERAFATPELTRKLEEIEHPFIKREFVHVLREEAAREPEGSEGLPRVCAVEVQLLDRALDLVEYADEIIAVTVPLELRRERAIGRGMTGEDFDRRVALQPTDEYLAEHADTIIDNSGSQEDLDAAIEAWWEDFAARTDKSRGDV